MFQTFSTVHVLLWWHAGAHLLASKVRFSTVFHSPTVPRQSPLASRRPVISNTAYGARRDHEEDYVIIGLRYIDSRPVVESSAKHERVSATHYGLGLVPRSEERKRLQNQRIADCDSFAGALKDQGEQHVCRSSGGQL